MITQTKCRSKNRLYVSVAGKWHFTVKSIHFYTLKNKIIYGIWTVIGIVSGHLQHLGSEEQFYCQIVRCNLCYAYILVSECYLYFKIIGNMTSEIKFFLWIHLSQWNGSSILILTQKDKSHWKLRQNERKTTSKNISRFPDEICWFDSRHLDRSFCHSSNKHAIEFRNPCRKHRTEDYCNTHHTFLITNRWKDHSPNQILLSLNFNKTEIILNSLV